MLQLQSLKVEGTHYQFGDIVLFFYLKISSRRRNFAHGQPFLVLDEAFLEKTAEKRAKNTESYAISQKDKMIFSDKIMMMEA